VKRVRFHLRHQVDEGRVDVVEVREGAVLVDTQVTGKYSPLVSVSQLVRVELLDDVASTAQAVEHAVDASVTPTPTPSPETEVRTLHINPDPVPTHVSPDTPSRWGALPLGEEAQ